jgi:hypothetical protein
LDIKNPNKKEDMLECSINSLLEASFKESQQILESIKAEL